MKPTTCLNCNRNSSEIPLLQLEYRGQTYAICPQCMPILIHKPHTLAEKLPGVENLKPVS